MTDRLSLLGITVMGRHGVEPHERECGQRFVVDVVLHLDVRPAATSDRLVDTVDYAVLSRRLADIVEGEPVDLIETLAERLAQACLRDGRVEAVDVSVHKPAAPLSVPCADVVVTVHRSQAVPPAVTET